MLQVLGESTWAMGVRVIRGDKGVGDIPGVRGDSGESEVLRNMDSICQELDGSWLLNVSKMVML